MKGIKQNKIPTRNRIRAEDFHTIAAECCISLPAGSIVDFDDEIACRVEECQLQLIELGLGPIR